MFIDEDYDILLKGQNSLITIMAVMYDLASFSLETAGEECSVRDLGIFQKNPRNGEL